MRFVIRLVVLCLALTGVAYGYTFTMARVGAADAPDMVAPELRADSIFVDKTMRRLDLLKDGKVLRSYQISLGAMPAGHKTREGDERTPTGTYLIDWRNASSIAHLSLHISYPNAADQAQAQAAGASPGGNIMIHGIANGWGWIGGLHRKWDWTNGCIAVTNAEMREIWSMTPNGTPITITE